MSSQALARFVSIVGHPVAMVPASAAYLALSNGIAVRPIALIAASTLASCALVMWARRNVAQGEWSHVDASEPAERKRWNIVVLGVLLALAFVIWTSEPLVALGLASLSAIMICALAFSPWLKLSQHVAFAAFATCLVASESVFAAIIAGSMTGAVALSRLALLRHTVREIIVGALCGAGAGLALTHIVPLMYR